MKTISVSAAKARLSHWLRLVQRGEVVVVESRGKAVARIVPPIPSDAGADEARRARLEAAGILRRAEKPPSLEFLSWPRPVLDEEHSLLRAVLEMREEER